MSYKLKQISILQYLLKMKFNSHLAYFLSSGYSS